MKKNHREDPKLFLQRERSRIIQKLVSNKINDTTTTTNKNNATSSTDGINSTIHNNDDDDMTMIRAIDDVRLQNAVRDAGMYASGISAVEVWLYDEDSGQLNRPPLAWWCDPIFMMNNNNNEAIRKLKNDPTDPEYNIEPISVMPGVDLAGILFAESYYSNGTTTTTKKNGVVSTSSIKNNNNNQDPDDTTTKNDTTRTTSSSSRLVQDFFGRRSCNSNRSNNMLNRSFDERRMVQSFDPRLIYNTASVTNTTTNNRHTNIRNSILNNQSFDPRRKRKLMISSLVLFGNKGKIIKKEEDGSEIEEEDEAMSLKLFFRDIRSLLLDPDTPKTLRLSIIQQAGFNKAAGIPFHHSSNNNKGIVIFYTSYHADKDKDDEENNQNSCSTTTDNENHQLLLSSIPNLVYLHRATDIIAAVAASTDARRASHAVKFFNEANNNSNNNNNNIQHHHSATTTTTANTDTNRGNNNNNNHEEKSNNNHENNNNNNRVLLLQQALKRWWSKCLGGGLQIPPSMTWYQSTWTLMGSFLTLLLFSFTNKMIGHFTEDEYFLLMGPMGALITLQYGLTSAPASQPRNIICGQIISGVVVLPLALYVPQIPHWIQMAVGPALAITIMVKCGVVHPPAGAAAVLWATGKFGWQFYALMLASSILSIIPCAIINNINAKRQYPTYWGCCSNTKITK